MGRTLAEVVPEYGAREDIWASDRGNMRRVEKTA